MFPDGDDGWVVAKIAGLVEVTKVGAKFFEDVSVGEITHLL